MTATEIQKMILDEIDSRELSNTVFGRMIGVSDTTVRHWRMGRRTISLTMADRALKALGMTATIGKE